MKDLQSSPKGVGWGTTNIPKEDWIDVDKTYKTRDGKRVENLQIVLHNSCGSEVTYPVKGNIVVREKPRKTEYSIWSLDGKADVVFRGKEHNDLKQVKAL